KHAGLKTYAKILNDEDIKYEKWNIQELLYSIPEISSFVSQDDLNLKYVIPSTLVWDEDETFHKISNIYEDKIKDVINFDKNYLPVGKNNKDELILRPSLNGLDLSSESYSGQKYFTLGHYKNKKLVQYNYFTYTFIALYGLATLGRYHTDIWTNFINNNSSSYIGIIEKFLEFCTRYLPNFALDKLTNKKNYYSNELFLNNQL